MYLAALSALMVLAGCILDYREHRALADDEADDEEEDEAPVDDTPAVGHRPEERFDRPSPPLP